MGASFCCHTNHYPSHLPQTAINRKQTMQPFKFTNTTTNTSITLSAQEIDGNIWFVANDVCAALGLHRSAGSRLDSDEKGMRDMHTPGGIQRVLVINEAGLYSLIFKSNKDQAKQFRKWVTSDVIPSIRKHGGYVNGQEALSLDAQAQTVRVVQEEAQRVGLCLSEEQDARREAFKLLHTTVSYGPGGNPKRKKAIAR